MRSAQIKLINLLNEDLKTYEGKRWSKLKNIEISRRTGIRPQHIKRTLDSLVRIGAITISCDKKTGERIIRPKVQINGEVHVDPNKEYHMIPKLKIHKHKGATLVNFFNLQQLDKKESRINSSTSVLEINPPRNPEIVLTYEGVELTSEDINEVFDANWLVQEWNKAAMYKIKDFDKAVKMIEECAIIIGNGRAPGERIFWRLKYLIDKSLKKTPHLSFNYLFNPVYIKKTNEGYPQTPAEYKGKRQRVQELINNRLRTLGLRGIRNQETNDLANLMRLAGFKNERYLSQFILREELAPVI